MEKTTGTHYGEGWVGSRAGLKSVIYLNHSRTTEPTTTMYFNWLF